MGNIYKFYRQQAGISQDKAAEALCVAVRTMARYETGETIPPFDIVERMAEIYKNPRIIEEHHRNFLRMFCERKRNRRLRAVI